MTGYDAQGNFHCRDGQVIEKKNPRKELETLRAFKAAKTAGADGFRNEMNNALAKAGVEPITKPASVTLSKPVETVKTVEVKQDKRRANKALSFDYSSPEFLKALKLK